MRERRMFHHARPFDLAEMLRGFAPIAFGIITGATFGFVLAVLS